MTTTCTTPDTRKTQTPPTLRDFVIQGAAELGACRGAQSFRALRRQDGKPVLLHKFRPAAPLIALGRIVEDREPPDFRKPFITQFTGLFAVAGSAYLVEPLPPCSGLGDVWRHVLHSRPHQTVTVLAVLIRQMISVTRPPLDRDRRHGALDLRSIVLAPTGCFGVLASHVDCEQGTLWLRTEPENPPRPESHCLIEVLGSLLELDAEMSALRKLPVRLPVDLHRRIRALRCAVRQANPGARQQSRT